MYHDTKGIFDQFGDFQRKILKIYGKKIKDHASKNIFNEIVTQADDISDIKF